MPAPDPLLTVAVASSALFDLGAGEAVFASAGREAYRRYQHEHEHEPPPPGPALPFVRRLLRLNRPDEAPLVEVVLISRNDPDTGVRVRNAIEHHRLPVVRTVFTGGRAPWPYLAAFEAALFLTARAEDVTAAIAAGHPAGLVLPGAASAEDEGDAELRVAFDFDGVLASDESERVYRERGLAGYREQERTLVDTPLAPGPLAPLLTRLARVQAAEAARQTADPAQAPRLRTAIITARSAPADRRVITTLRAWGLQVDESFFVGDLPKDRIVRLFRPHLFFDDKRANAELVAGCAASVHVPFGILNQPG